MELQYNYILAAWLATWVIAQWKLFIPSMLILREADPTNVCIRWWPATWIIFAIGTLLLAPIFLLPILSDRYRDIFVKSYVNSLIKIET
tara:strand:+ start:904 stop:1170 length:267 start_codon:yes stop_codon:yes gene_type:complete